MMPSATDCWMPKVGNVCCSGLCGRFDTKLRERKTHHRHYIPRRHRPKLLRGSHSGFLCQLSLTVPKCLTKGKQDKWLRCFVLQTEHLAQALPGTPAKEEQHPLITNENYKHHRSTLYPARAKVNSDTAARTTSSSHLILLLLRLKISLRSSLATTAVRRHHSARGS